MEPGSQLTNLPTTVPTPSSTTRLETQRLYLRVWQDADAAPFAAMNADPRVMRYFPAPLTRAESDAFLEQRVLPHFAEHGYGLWALERRRDGAFLGTVGLMWQTFPAPFTPALEVGWRLAVDAWGHGYATEAASASLQHAFDRVRVDEVVSMTSVVNAPSRAVMERLAMTHDPDDDFDHPRVPDGSPLRRHVLYRASRSRWSSSAVRHA